MQPWGWREPSPRLTDSEPLQVVSHVPGVAAGCTCCSEPLPSRGAPGTQPGARPRTARFVERAPLASQPAGASLPSRFLVKRESALRLCGHWPGATPSPLRRRQDSAPRKSAPAGGLPARRDRTNPNGMGRRPPPRHDRPRALSSARRGPACVQRRRQTPRAAPAPAPAREAERAPCAPGGEAAARRPRYPSAPFILARRGGRSARALPAPGKKPKKSVIGPEATWSFCKVPNPNRPSLLAAREQISRKEKLVACLSFLDKCG